MTSLKTKRLSWKDLLSCLDQAPMFFTLAL